ncbi:MAG: helix-turn-helix transcriptional regulator [Alphaproteobacteria bacterium]
MTITNRIKFWRQQRGWTLQHLAEASGTTRAQIDKLERGTRRLTVEWMVRLAKPLGCDPRSLMALADIPVAATADVIPVFRLRPARKSGHYIHAASSQSAPKTVPRPYFLNGIPETRGVIVPDATCTPALRPGQTAFLAPSRKPRATHPVYVTHSDHSGAFYIFVHRAKDTIHLRHIHPARKDFIFTPGEITAIASVVGTAEK